MKNKEGYIGVFGERKGKGEMMYLKSQKNKRRKFLLD